MKTFKKTVSAFAFGAIVLSGLGVGTVTASADIAGRCEGPIAIGEDPADAPVIERGRNNTLVDYVRLVGTGDLPWHCGAGGTWQAHRTDCGGDERRPLVIAQLALDGVFRVDC